ncbi:MAG: hypothetical protein WBD95_24395 [Xanthobacteraceae bacterium]
MIARISASELEVRISKLEQAVFGVSKKSDKAAPSHKTDGGTKPADKLPDIIIRARDEGFFKSAKTANEVHGKLQPIYACSVDRIAMALLRLQRRKMLRKTSKVAGKKSQVAYAW